MYSRPLKTSWPSSLSWSRTDSSSSDSVSGVSGSSSSVRPRKGVWWNIFYWVSRCRLLPDNCASWFVPEDPFGHTPDTQRVESAEGSDSVWELLSDVPGLRLTHSVWVHVWGVVRVLPGRSDHSRAVYRLSPHPPLSTETLIEERYVLVSQRCHWLFSFLPVMVDWGEYSQTKRLLFVRLFRAASVFQLTALPSGRYKCTFSHHPIQQPHIRQNHNR